MTDRLILKSSTAELTLQRRNGGVLLTVEEDHRPHSSSMVQALARNPVQLYRALTGQQPNLPRIETQRRMVRDVHAVQVLTPFRLSHAERQQVEAFLQNATGPK